MVQWTIAAGVLLDDDFTEAVVLFVHLDLSLVVNPTDLSHSHRTPSVVRLGGD
jgi:hypothetical protein